MESSVFKKVSFVKSIVVAAEKPRAGLPEIAFAGRSNVGKSSLLNALFNRRQLAKVSSSPGKTQLINFYLVDQRYYFVDLPGYGYARLPQSVSKNWQKMIESYLLKNSHLKMTCLLIDSRREPLEKDGQMISWLDYNAIPFIIVLTKWDKLSASERTKNLQRYQQEYPDRPIVQFSIKSDKFIKNLSEMLLERLNTLGVSA